MTVHLEPGRFYAGVSLPFFITHAMVAHKLESMGFSNVSFHDREKEIASLKVDPKKYPAYDDSWSEWIEADWTGPKKDLEFEKHWSWLLVVPNVSSPPDAGGTPPPSSPTDPVSGFEPLKPRMIGGSVLGVGFLVLVLGFLLKKA